MGMGGYLAYGRGKITVVGVYDTFILVLDSIPDQLGELDLPPKDVPLQSLQPTSLKREPTWPNLRLREVQFGDPDMFNMDTFLCLQLTEAKLLVSVLSNDRMVGERDESMRCYDFALSP